MVHAKRVGPAIAAGLALSLALAACGGDKSSDGNNSDNAGGGTKGGTVTVFYEKDFEHLDPTRNFVADSGLVGKLIGRTLTEFRWDAKKKKSELMPDLAEKWESTPDLKTWTFHLRSGLKYEDGSDIKTADIKYNVERSYSPDLAEGASYAKEYLDCPGYKGPYVAGNNGGKGCTAITVPDANTIVFKLNRPVAEFDSTVSMKTFTPVPQAKDAKTQYDNHPFSSGPYKIESYIRKKSLTLVRNTYWDAKTDPLRTALPDKFVFQFGDDPAIVDQRLIADGTNDQSSISLTGLQPQNIAKTNTARVKPRVIEGGDYCRRYIGFNEQHAALKNQKLREALYVALDRNSYMEARGGNRLAAVVDSIVPEDLDGYQKESFFNVPPGGDVTKAKQLLQEAGYKGEKLVLGTADTGLATKASEAAQASWKKAGINVDIKKIPGDNYYGTQQNDASATDLITAGWCFDWPSMAAVVAPVLGPDSTVPNKPAQNNYSRQTTDFAQMAKIALMTDKKAATAEWSKVYSEVMKTAPLVPTVKDLNVYVIGSNVEPPGIDPNSGGLPDVTQISLKTAK